MRRDCILIANSVTYGDASKSISKAVMRSVVNELEENLSRLDGSSAFNVTKILDEQYLDARERIRKAIKKSGTAGNTLLLYYFGHGIKPTLEEELYLYCSDSDLDDPGTMIAFTEVVKWLKDYKIPKVIVVLDCCYAGTVATKMHLLQPIARSYYLMASVNPKEKALVDYGDERAYGVFSKYVLRGFKSTGARANGRQVTLRSFFNYVHKRTKEASLQEPYSVDNNLADEVFFVQSSAPAIERPLRSVTPKKSIYRKLFVIGMSLYKHGQQSERYLYASLKRRRPPELLQPKKIPNGTKYEFVGESAFHNYIRLAVLLGIVQGGDLLSLTPVGRDMMQHAGASYNITLHNMIMKQWRRLGLKLQDFEDAIYQRMQTGSPPSLLGIHRDLVLSRKAYVSKQLFSILFDLTGYVGALNYSADKTFFPPNLEESE